MKRKESVLFRIHTFIPIHHLQQKKIRGYDVAFISEPIVLLHMMSIQQIGYAYVKPIGCFDSRKLQ